MEQQQYIIHGRFDGSTSRGEGAFKDLRRAKEAAELANRAKGIFLANISHEIRTPLGIILGFAEILKNQELPLADRLEFIKAIERNGKQLLVLVNDLLDLSKVEAGRVTIEKTRFSLREELNHTLSPQRQKALAKGLQFDLTFSPNVPSEVITDATRLGQILTNVVGNAIKFTRKGRVSIHCALVRGKTIEIEVEDTGIGIADNQRDRIWEPFVQGDCSTSHEFGGTGLGLALSRKLAHALGGDLELHEAELGLGSRFIISIPVESASASRMAQTRPTIIRRRHIDCPPQNKTLKGTAVLLVEDVIDNQILFHRMLTMAGADVAVAKGGLEALKIASNKHFDVILMDIQMAEMDGHQAAHLLRAQGFDGSILALTAHAMKNERERSNHLFDGYLTKPIKREVLVDEVRCHALH